MKISAFLSFALLSISILSFGFVDLVFADGIIGFEIPDNGGNTPDDSFEWDYTETSMKIILIVLYHLFQVTQ